MKFILAVSLIANLCLIVAAALNYLDGARGIRRRINIRRASKTLEKVEGARHD